VGRESTAQRQELGERAVYGDGPKQSFELGSGAARHSSVRHDVWKCSSQNRGSLSTRSRNELDLCSSRKLRYLLRSRLWLAWWSQQVNVTDNSATSNYQALQAKFERRLSHGLQALASYTWSHSIDVASTDAAFNYLGAPGSIGTPQMDRGNSDFDIRHAFSAGVTYNAPTPEWNTVARAAFGGWSVDAFISARSAPPVNITSGPYFADGVALNPRPNLVPGVPLEF